MLPSTATGPIIMIKFGKLPQNTFDCVEIGCAQNSAPIIVTQNTLFAFHGGTTAAAVDKSCHDRAMRFLNPVTTDLTYSDVFLVPSFSQISSRMDVDISSTDGTGTTIPIVSSNMNGVTGRRMVETIARRGGIGIFPQDTPLHLMQESIDWIK